MKNQLQNLGVGLSYRSSIHSQIIESSDEIDFLEVIPDQFIYAEEKAVDSILEDLKIFPLVSHGVDLSIGTDCKLDYDYLDKISLFLEKSESVCYSEHICFTKVPGIDLGQLSPLQFSREMVDIVSKNFKKVSDHLGEIPICLENISYYLEVPGAEMSEAEFVSNIIEKSGCGLLLDVNNLYVNSVNRDYDPLDFLQEIPLDSVQMIHLAGYQKDGDMLLDSHDCPVSDEVWNLYEKIVSSAPVKAVIFEQDENLDNFELLMEQVLKARSIFEQNGR